MSLRHQTGVVRFPARRALWLAALVAVCRACPTDARAQAQQAAESKPINQVEAVPTPGPRWVPGYRFRYPLRVVGDLGKHPAEGVIAKIPTGGWLRPDAADLTMQTADGTEHPVSVLSHDPLGDTVIQFRRSGEDRWYWVSGGNPRAQPARAEPVREGMVAEFREWAGDKLDSWAAVLDGLKKSENVTGNAIVGEIRQTMNPTRPHSARTFAASYRGFLTITTPGVHRFFVNSEDASFLFIDGFKVSERTGQNGLVTGVIPRGRFGTEIELTAGVHPVEVHHVIGNNPAATGACMLLWLPPTPNAKWGVVPRSSFVEPLYAHVCGVEEASGAAIGTIGFGVEDALDAGGVELYLTRFEAQGAFPDDTPVTWDFGDGTTGTGRSVRHVYFRNGPYKVSLAVGKSPAFHRTVTAWAVPGATSPLALPRTVEAIATSEWRKLDAVRLNQLVEFLLVCGTSNRWPLAEQVAGFLLARPAADQDPQVRATLYALRMRALAELGRAREALKLVEPAAREFAKLPGPRVQVQMAEALVHHRGLREPAEADRVYTAIIEENRRVEVPEVREAAIRWGDMLTESGETGRAAEAYRLAASLTADRTAGNTDLATRGALIRVIEQKLRAGDVRECGRLLAKIETTFPEMKLDGLYRFLRGEADRFSGRYEDAIRNYGLMAAMPQWAGYRDRAAFGIADAHYRMKEFAQALAMLDEIEVNHPAFYAERKLADYRKLVEGCVSRSDASRVADGKAAPFFAGFTTGFEPDEKAAWLDSMAFPVVAGGGMQGRHVGLLHGPVHQGIHVFTRKVTNLAPGGSCWVEIWYRENLQLESGFVDMVNNVALGAPPSYGDWRRLGFPVKATSPDAQVTVGVRHVAGAMEIDGFSIQPVSDEDRTAVLNFIEGTPEQ